MVNGDASKTITEATNLSHVGVGIFIGTLLEGCNLANVAEAVFGSRRVEILDEQGEDLKTLVHQVRAVQELGETGGGQGGVLEQVCIDLATVDLGDRQICGPIDDL